MSLLFTQLRVPLFTKQQFTSILIILYTSFSYNNNCSLDLYSRDLRTTIILFSRNVSSHKTDKILTDSRVFTKDWPNSNWLACLYTRQTEFLLNHCCLLCLAFYITRVSNLMNALVWECLRKISIVYFVYVR